MDLTERAEQAVAEVFGILEIEPAEEATHRARQAIEKAIIDAVLAEQERCAGVAAQCCAADQDMAHKLSTEIRHTRDMLITNLTALR